MESKTPFVNAVIQAVEFSVLLCDKTCWRSSVKLEKAQHPCMFLLHCKIIWIMLMK